MNGNNHYYLIENVNLKLFFGKDELSIYLQGSTIFYQDSTA